MNIRQVKNFFKAILPDTLILLYKSSTYQLNNCWVKFKLRRGINQLADENFIRRDIEAELLIGTKEYLYLFAKGNLYKLLKGHFYGISQYKEHWYAYQYFRSEKFFVGRGPEAQLIRFKLRARRICSIEHVIFLPKACHQIDFIGDLLYITDTYHNRIIVFDTNKKKIINNFFPVGKLKNGRTSENYVHCNSIFRKNDQIYLVFHNLTSSSGKNSEIVSVEDNFLITSKIMTQGGNAHNICIVNEDIYYCDSINNSLRIKEQEVFKCDSFTRGLSISDDIIVVGGSAIRIKNRDYDTESSKGAIYFLDRNHNLILRVTIPAEVLEIRRLDKKDYCLSNNNSTP